MSWDSDKSGLTVIELSLSLFVFLFFLSGSLSLAGRTNSVSARIIGEWKWNWRTGNKLELETENYFLHNYMSTDGRIETCFSFMTNSVLAFPSLWRLLLYNQMRWLNYLTQGFFLDFFHFRFLLLTLCACVNKHLNYESNNKLTSIWRQQSIGEKICSRWK